MFLTTPLTIALSLGLGLSAPVFDAEEAMDKLAESLKSVNDSDEDERDAALEGVRSAIDTLSGGFASYDEKEQKTVVGAIGKVFSVRTHERDGDTSADQIYFNAAAALSDMGDEAEKVLKKAMKVKHLEKKPEVQEIIIEALGHHKNEKNIDVFIKLLVDDDPKIVRAAVKSLGEFHESDAKVRKEIAEALVKQYANTHNLDLREKGRNPVWRDRLTTIEVPMNEALGKLTLQSFQAAPDWEKWYNDNRSKSW